ncbi:MULTISPECIES: hypothetical protein [Streptomonospora]|uniref:Helicase-associated domain-containing protein n=2 Tax=Streptomonospora TaxID=104204 RepID=A0ABV9SEC8_9ACTN
MAHDQAFTRRAPVRMEHAQRLLVLLRLLGWAGPNAHTGPSAVVTGVSSAPQQKAWWDSSFP